MKKKMIIVAVLVCCIFTSIITVKAVSKKGAVLAYDGTTMQAVIDDNIEKVFHASIYPKTINRDTIQVYNLVYRKNIFNQPTNKLNQTFYIDRTYTSYIFNTQFNDNSKKWAKSEWWNKTMGSTLTGDFYLVNGHDTNA